MLWNVSVHSSCSLYSLSKIPVQIPLEFNIQNLEIICFRTLGKPVSASASLLEKDTGLWGQ